MKLSKTKKGHYTLELENVESVSDYKSTTTFVFLSPEELEQLSFLIWAEVMDSGLRKIASEDSA